jgi:hypothetical protein
VFYALDYAGERLTLELERAVDEYWMWGALVGPRNTEPSNAAVHAVNAWLGRRGVVTDAQIEEGLRYRGEAAE